MDGDKHNERDKRLLSNQLVYSFACAHGYHPHPRYLQQMHPPQPGAYPPPGVYPPPHGVYPPQHGYPPQGGYPMVGYPRHHSWYCCVFNCGGQMGSMLAASFGASEHAHTYVQQGDNGKLQYGGIEKFKHGDYGKFNHGQGNGNVIFGGNNFKKVKART